MFLFWEQKSYSKKIFLGNNIQKNIFLILRIILF